jgi:hypothetical protein
MDWNHGITLLPRVGKANGRVCFCSIWRKGTPKRYLLLHYLATTYPDLDGGIIIALLVSSFRFTLRLVGGGHFDACHADIWDYLRGWGGGMGGKASTSTTQLQQRQDLSTRRLQQLFISGSRYLACMKIDGWRVDGVLAVHYLGAGTVYVFIRPRV